MVSIKNDTPVTAVVNYELVDHNHSIDFIDDGSTTTSSSPGDSPEKHKASTKEGSESATTEMPGEQLPTTGKTQHGGNVLIFSFLLINAKF